MRVPAHAKHLTVAEARAMWSSCYSMGYKAPPGAPKKKKERVYKVRATVVPAEPESPEAAAVAGMIGLASGFAQDTKIQMVSLGYVCWWLCVG